ncbi:MAG TPA: hypothetical protein VF054_02315 [Micromonosporaceae bacterium]
MADDWLWYEARRRSSRGEVWGEVRDAAGGRRSATMTTPNGYDLTADSVVRAVGFLRTGEGPAGPVGAGASAPNAPTGAGAMTSAIAFGDGYVDLLDGVRVDGPD